MSPLFGVLLIFEFFIQIPNTTFMWRVPPTHVSMQCYFNSDLAYLPYDWDDCKAQSKGACVFFIDGSSLYIIWMVCPAL